MIPEPPGEGGYRYPEENLEMCDLSPQFQYWRTGTLSLLGVEVRRKPKYAENVRTETSLELL
jgi:hypothetical protein